MEKQNRQQEELDVLYKDQMRLDLQLEDNQDEQKALRLLREDLEYSQGDALYQLNDGGNTFSPLLLYPTTRTDG